ncbi:autotransporter outer membrane beta-barrel domain-containing protein [Yersinia enterocolitica]|uniref:autotransporter outer membrane beta-barrel domain-containing protein n=1 Tax=Yersinia enterocolitica TaxID=630 RepID=UPI0021558592|nr:autotransporter outer membrane beta-barrel domain-containing protein [Yersinia enterocolitica]
MPAIGKNDRLGVGVMAGYGYNNNQTQSNRTGYKSRGTVDGYSAGIYATWYQDAKNQQGAYVDSWLQYSKLNASEQGDELAMQSYNINGLSASVESGYRMPVYHGVNGDVFVTPQAQVIWDGQKADTVHDDSNTQVQSTGADVINTRIGVRVARDSVSDQDKGKDKLFTVYSEVNWLHNSKDPGVAMDNITVSQAGSRNVGEIKLGAEGKLNKNCNTWANIGQQIGGSGYNDSRVTAGLKYAF